jgi:O-antigen/teichoic acid export membrane protein
MRELVGDARGWLLKGGTSIADQAMIAGANFILNVLLGRWLPPVQYGAFAFSYSIFLLLGTFHTASFSEPMMVFGAGKYADRFGRYIGVLTMGHLVVTVPFSILLLVASFLLGRFYSPEVQHALAALALASPIILLQWLLRRAFYVIYRPEWALLGGASYLVFLLGAIFALRASGRLSPAAAFLAMGLSALLVSLLLLGRLRPKWSSPDGPSASSVGGDHWRYGRWALGTAALSWVPGNLYYTLLPAWVGLEGIAALRALTNLILPVVHTISALSLLLLPLLARFQRENKERMTRTLRLFLLLFLAGSGIYNLVLIFFRREVVRLLYGSQYANAVPLVPLVGLLAFLSSFITVLGTALRALERPEKIFWSYLGSSAVAVGSGILLARRLGVAGGLWGLLLSSLTTVLMMFIFYRSVYKKWRWT